MDEEDTLNFALMQGSYEESAPDVLFSDDVFGELSRMSRMEAVPPML